MGCTSNIVDCLRAKSIEPETFAYSHYDERYLPSNALVYSKDNQYASKYSDEPQWWMINFKQVCGIAGYQIISYKSGDNMWIYNWSISISFDNNVYKPIHNPSPNVEEEKTYIFKKPINAQYLRIDGNSQWSQHKNSFGFYYVKFFGQIAPLYYSSVSCKKGMNVRLIQAIFLLYSV